jgi:flagellar M-ring protein FliF
MAAAVLTCCRSRRRQVNAIQNIIAASVPSLKPERIAIADERGQLLSQTALTAGNTQANMQMAEEMRISYEDRTARAVENLLERSLGYGKVRAQVSATIDMARTNQEERIFGTDPVVRSTQSVTDTSEQSESDGNPSVTIANNLPAGNASSGGGITNTSRSSRTEETVNNEISSTIRNSVIEPGRISRISVAVMVDNAQVSDGNGGFTSQARTQQELEKLADLVRSAIGFDGQRGDQVEVVNLQFAGEDDFGRPLTIFGMQKEDLMKLAEIAVLGIVGVLVVLLVVRPLLTRLFEASPTAASASAGAALLAGEGDGLMMGKLTGPGGGLAALPPGEGGSEVDDMIDLNRIEGRVKASTLRKIGELIDRNPEEVVSVIRNWLYQEAGNN